MPSHLAATLLHHSSELVAQDGPRQQALLSLMVGVEVTGGAGQRWSGCSEKRCAVLMPRLPTSCACRRLVCAWKRGGPGVAAEDVVQAFTCRHQWHCALRPTGVRCTLNCASNCVYWRELELR